MTVAASDSPGGAAGTAVPAAFTASSQAALAGSTSFGAVGPIGLPKIQLMPMRISEMPMTRMMVPVTTGGKKRSIRLATGASRMPMMPAPMIEPKIIRAPSVPGCETAIEIIGPTEAKVTPIITGIRTPNHGVIPSDCSIETMPQQKRSAEIRKATSSGASLSTRPMISGTAMAPAYITSTCCRPRAKSFGAGSTSSTEWKVVSMRVSGVGADANSRRATIGGRQRKGGTLPWCVRRALLSSIQAAPWREAVSPLA